MDIRDVNNLLYKLMYRQDFRCPICGEPLQLDAVSDWYLTYVMPESISDIVGNMSIDYGHDYIKHFDNIIIVHEHCLEYKHYVGCFSDIVREFKCPMDLKDTLLCSINRASLYVRVYNDIIEIMSNNAENKCQKCGRTVNNLLCSITDNNLFSFKNHCLVCEDCNKLMFLKKHKFKRLGVNKDVLYKIQKYKWDESISL